MGSEWFGGAGNRQGAAEAGGDRRCLLGEERRPIRAVRQPGVILAGSPVLLKHFHLQR